MAAFTSPMHDEETGPQEDNVEKSNQSKEQGHVYPGFVGMEPFSMPETSRVWSIILVRLWPSFDYYLTNLAPMESGMVILSPTVTISGVVRSMA
jgi:hypothetical protein